MRQFFLLSAAVVASSISTYLITRTAEAETKTTAVLIDEEDGVIRFVINGKEVGTLDKNGLSIDGSVAATHGISAPPITGLSDVRAAHSAESAAP